MLNIIKSQNVIMENPSNDSNEEEEIEYTYETLMKLKNSNSTSGESQRVPSLAELNGGISENEEIGCNEEENLSSDLSENTEEKEEETQPKEETSEIGENDEKSQLQESPHEDNDNKEDLDALKQQIISDAMAQKEKILEQAKKESTEILKQSVEQGLRDGMDAAKKEIAEKVSQWSDEISYLADIQERKLMEINRKVAQISVDVAKKIIGIRLDLDPMALLPLTKEAVASLDTDEKITVYLSKKMPELIEAVKSEFLDRSNIKVKGDDLNSDGVMVETLDEILDASVSTQLANLKTQFDRLNFKDI